MNPRFLLLSIFLCCYFVLSSSSNDQVCNANFSNYVFDLAVVQDATKDYRHLAKYFTEHMATIFDELQKVFPESRLGVVTFSDESYQTWESKSQAYHVLSSLTVRREALLKNIADITVCEDCGGHFPDSSLVATASAATDEDLRWLKFPVNARGRKIVKSLILITNTDPLMAGDQKNSTLGNYLQKDLPVIGRQLEQNDIYFLGLIGPAGQAAWSSHLKAMTGARGTIQNMPGAQSSDAGGDAVAKLIIDGMKKLICQYFEVPVGDASQKDHGLAPGYLDESQENGKIALASKEKPNASQENLNASQENLNASQKNLNASQKNLNASQEGLKTCKVTVSIEKPWQLESPAFLPISVVEKFDRISSPVPSSYSSDFGLDDGSPITLDYTNLVVTTRNVQRKGRRKGSKVRKESYMVASADRPTSLRLKAVEGVEINYIGALLKDIHESNQIDVEFDNEEKYSWRAEELLKKLNATYYGNASNMRSNKPSAFVNWKVDGNCRIRSLTLTGAPGSTAPINIDNLTLGTSYFVSGEVVSKNFKKEDLPAMTRFAWDNLRTSQDKNFKDYDFAPYVFAS